MTRLRHQAGLLCSKLSSILSARLSSRSCSRIYSRAPLWERHGFAIHATVPAVDGLARLPASAVRNSDARSGNLDTKKPARGAGRLSGSWGFDTAALRRGIKSIFGADHPARRSFSQILTSGLRRFLVRRGGVCVTRLNSAAQPTPKTGVRKMRVHRHWWGRDRWCGRAWSDPSRSLGARTR
jgi:hypothetical protein